MLWILGAGTQWHMLRQYCPNYKTAYREVAECGVARLLLGVTEDAVRWTKNFA